MNRRTRLGLVAGLGLLTGLRPRRRVVGVERSSAGNHAGEAPRECLAASLQTAERVETLGRQIIAQNTFTGLDPLFHTIGVPEPMLFHRGTAELFVSEGLVNRCKTEAELAAVLCSELGQMMAEKQAAADRPGQGPDPGRRPARRRGRARRHPGRRLASSSRRPAAATAEPADAGEARPRPAPRGRVRPGRTRPGRAAPEAVRPR